MRIVVRTWFGLMRSRLAGRHFQLRMALQDVYVQGPCLANVAGRIQIGRGAIIQKNLALGVKPGGALVIGAGTRIGADAFIGCADSVTLGDNVLIAARCFIADFGHAFQDLSRPVLHQGATLPRAVSIGEGSWLGINVVILPGTQLGRHCVVAANSVVNGSFPDYSVIGGNPARLLKSLAEGGGAQPGSGTAP